MSTTEHPHPTHELSQEDQRVVGWRFDQFRQLGFGEEDSAPRRLGADLQLTRSLVGAGCPLHLAPESSCSAQQGEWASCRFSLHSLAVEFRMFRGPSDYPHLVRIINVWARAEGDDRVETSEGIASDYDHLDRCDPPRDLLVAEIDGAPVGYSRVWWDQEPDGPRSTSSCASSIPSTGAGASAALARLERGAAA